MAPSSKSTHESKSQHGGRGPTFEPQETIKIWFILIKIKSSLFYANQLMGLVLRVGSNFLVNPTLNTSPNPHLRKVFAM